MRHDRLADVPAGLPEDADHLGGRGGVAPRVDDDGAAQLGLGVRRGPQHLLLAVRDGPAAADFPDDAAADARPVGAVEHLVRHDDAELRGRGTANPQGGGLRCFVLVLTYLQNVTPSFQC